MQMPSQRERKLNLQKGQNPADCLIASACMCINMPIYQAKTILGHDGTEKLWPALQPPHCYRGFTYAEIIMLAYLKGFACIYHEFEGQYSPYYGITPRKMLLPAAYRNHVLKHSIGIVTLEQGSTFHAVALCDSIIYDPRGTTYLLPEAQFKFVQSCLTFEPRVSSFVTSHDINTLMAIQRG